MTLPTECLGKRPGLPRLAKVFDFFSNSNKCSTVETVKKSFRNKYRCDDSKRLINLKSKGALCHFKLRLNIHSQG